MTRGEIESEIDELFGGGGKATQVYRGLAKVLEDRAEFEVVADVSARCGPRKGLHGGGRLSPPAPHRRDRPRPPRRRFAATRCSTPSPPS